MAAYTAEFYEVLQDEGALETLPTLGKEQVFSAALEHDIGKLTVSRRLLNSKIKGLPDHLYSHLKDHTIEGSKALGTMGDYEEKVAFDMAKYHHENWDGIGGHQRLKGKDIPFFARLAAITDVFEAITGDRSYRKPMSDERALQVLRDGKGSKFDPELTDLFIKNFSSIRERAEQSFGSFLALKEKSRRRLELSSPREDPLSLLEELNVVERETSSEPHFERQHEIKNRVIVNTSDVLEKSRRYMPGGRLVR